MTEQEFEKTPPRDDDLKGLIEVMINEQGSMCTIQFHHRYIITLYSSDKSTIIVKHLGSMKEARAWVDSYFWKDIHL